MTNSFIFFEIQLTKANRLPDRYSTIVFQEKNLKATRLNFNFECRKIEAVNDHNNRNKTVSIRKTKL